MNLSAFLVIKNFCKNKKASIGCWKKHGNFWSSKRKKSFHEMLDWWFFAWMIAKTSCNIVRELWLQFLGNLPLGKLVNYLCVILQDWPLKFTQYLFIMDIGKLLWNFYWVTIKLYSEELKKLVEFKKICICVRSGAIFKWDIFLKNVLTWLKTN